MSAYWAGDEASDPGADPGLIAGAPLWVPGALDSPDPLTERRLEFAMQAARQQREAEIAAQTPAPVPHRHARRRFAFLAAVLRCAGAVLVAFGTLTVAAGTKLGGLVS